MAKRKIWTQKQDLILKILKEQRSMRKWSEIARKMDEQFGITQRTGKQCRERYHNRLDSSILATEWTQGQEQLLFAMHEQMGNKWSQISHKLPGRSDNCVKNHFYSKLRKSVRRLNRIIQEEGCKSWRQIKLQLLNKIIEITQQRFKNSSKYQQQIIEKCLQIVNRLFNLDLILQQNSSQNQGIIRNFIDDIMILQLKIRKASRHLKECKEPLQQQKYQNNMMNKVDEGKKSEVKTQEFFSIFKQIFGQIMFIN